MDGEVESLQQHPGDDRGHHRKKGDAAIRKNYLVPEPYRIGDIAQHGVGTAEGDKGRLRRLRPRYSGDKAMIGALRPGSLRLLAPFQDRRHDQPREISLEYKLQRDNGKKASAVSIKNGVMGLDGEAWRPYMYI